MKDIKHSVGNRIRDLRKQKGLSQEQLGWEAGLHNTYIGAIERGEKNCSLETLEKIVKALKVEISELFPRGQERTDREIKSLISKQMDKLSPSILKPLADLMLGIGSLEFKKSKDKTKRKNKN